MGSSCSAIPAVRPPTVNIVRVEKAPATPVNTKKGAVKASAQVRFVRELATDIKQIGFDVDKAAGFAFLPGQSVKVHVTIDGETRVSSFSVASSPKELEAAGVFTLIVKHNGKNPVTRWLHEVALPGDAVVVEGGNGANFLAPNAASRVVLCAGGVGIAPMLSILSDITQGGHERVEHATLLYSAKTQSELVAVDDIERCVRVAGTDRVCATLLCSREAPSPTEGEESAPVRWRCGRIDRGMLGEVVEQNKDKLHETLFFLCGPPAMCDSVCDALMEMGVERESVRYDCWWQRAPAVASRADASG